VPDGAQQEVFRHDGLENGFGESVKAFFSPSARIAKDSGSRKIEIERFQDNPG